MKPKPETITISAQFFQDGGAWRLYEKDKYSAPWALDLKTIEFYWLKYPKVTHLDLVETMVGNLVGWNLGIKCNRRNIGKLPCSVVMVMWNSYVEYLNSR